jgi:hypothetical protein
MKPLAFEKKRPRRLWLGSLGALLAAALLGSCTQDPIFAMIAREVKPREPRIKGVPTKMAVFDDNSGYALYVGGTSLHRYAKGTDGKAVWDEGAVPQPPGKIIDLAATNGCLYALVNADSAELYRLVKGGTGWTKIPFTHTDFPRLQTVYGAADSEGKPMGDYLLVGAGKKNISVDDREDYAVFYLADNDTALNPLLTAGTSLLTGAVFAGGNYYFSTKGDGIYLAGGLPPSAPDQVADTEGINARGMILLPGNAVLAFSYSGDILKIDGSTALKLNTNTGPNLRGPAAVWKYDENDSGSLLLTAAASPNSTGSTYGYREIAITTGPLNTAAPAEIPFREPGNGAAGSRSTMVDNNRYKDTIESKPVNSIYQVPYEIDSEMPLFASIQGTGTAQDDTDGGLWSLRERDGGWQWNAE